MPDLTPIHHVKIPVSDVRASSEWYLRVLGLEVAIEFTEDGELRGVALKAPDGTTQIAFRYDPTRAAALAGFDLVALGVPTRDGVHAWVDHLAAIDTEARRPRHRPPRRHRPRRSPRPRRHRNPSLRHLTDHRPTRRIPMRHTDSGGDSEPLVLIHAAVFADWFVPFEREPAVAGRRRPAPDPRHPHRVLELRTRRAAVGGRPCRRVRGSVAPPRDRAGPGARSLLRLRGRAAAGARPPGAGRRARPGRAAADRPAPAAAGPGDGRRCDRPCPGRGDGRCRPGRPAYRLRHLPDGGVRSGVPIRDRVRPRPSRPGTRRTQLRLLLRRRGARARRVALRRGAGAPHRAAGSISSPAARAHPSPTASSTTSPRCSPTPAPPSFPAKTTCSPSAPPPPSPPSSPPRPPPSDRSDHVARVPSTQTW